MRQETSIRMHGQRGTLALALALVASVLVAMRAEPARANNDFQNGFEDQLGRIVATQVFAIGAQALTGGYVPVVAPAVYYAPVVYAPSYGPAYRSYYARPQKVKVRQVVYYQGRPCYDGCGGSQRGYQGGRGRPPHGNAYGHGRGGH